MSRDDDDYHLARRAMANTRCYHWLYQRAHIALSRPGALMPLHTTKNPPRIASSRSSLVQRTSFHSGQQVILQAIEMGGADPAEYISVMESRIAQQIAEIERALSGLARTFPTRCISSLCCVIR